MNGNRIPDIDLAINTEIDSIRVTYGYSSFEELSHSNPTLIIKSVDQLKAILIGSQIN